MVERTIAALVAELSSPAMNERSIFNSSIGKCPMYASDE